MEEVEHSPSSTHFNNFKLILWKSYLWHRYYWWWTILEIIGRCFFALYLSLSVKSDIKLTRHPVTYTTVQSRSDLLDTILSHDFIVYGPSTEFTDVLMMEVIKRIRSEKHISNNIQLISMSSQKEISDYVVNHSLKTGHQPISVFFHLINNETAPDKLHYEINQNAAIETRWLIEYEPIPGPVKKITAYWTGGFAALQLLINEVFIRIKLEDWDWVAPSTVNFQTFPYPEYETSLVDRDGILSAIVFTMIAAEVALSVPFIASIIFEKQNGVKSLLRIHRMEETLIWLGWFIKAFVVLIISVTLQVIILKIPFKGPASESVRYTDTLVLWTFFILFDAANLCLVLFLSSLFNKATIASLVHMFFHYISLVILYLTVSLNLRQTTRLFWQSPSLTLSKGMRFLVAAENHAVPFTWRLVRKFHKNESAMVLLPCYYFLVFQILLYFFLTLYFGVINPGDFGTRRSVFFLFELLLFGDKHKHPTESKHQVHTVNKSHVNKPRSNGSKKSYIKKQSSRIERSSSGAIREPISWYPEPSLLIEGLHKEYDHMHPHALENVDLEFYENEISVLLGPKDSGKTTLMSILSGAITYDDGYIYYKGIDVSADLNLLRNDLGICFKEDRLFHYMSVIQHLIFFGKLKGLSNDDAEEEADEYLVKLEIHNQRDAVVKDLSDVVKRKLCIAICLIGERKVLMLDEPMDGLDNKSKIKIWNLLSDMRTDRTIIISTSNAREAESVADRITIMESGFVIAHGSPKYLKDRIGIHYEILVSTNRENFDRVTEQVMNSADATVEREMDNEILYTVPSSESPNFAHLFANIERHSQQLEISNIGLTFNSIEHVLMRTGGLSDHPANTSGISVSGYENESEYQDMTDGFDLLFRQLKTLFWKKCLYVIKDYLNIIIRIIVPSLIAILLARITEEIDFNPYLVKTMSPNIYILRDSLLGNIHPRIMILSKESATEENYETYHTYIRKHGGITFSYGGQRDTESLLKYAEEDIFRYRRELLAAFRLQGSDTAKILYNLRTSHSLPIAISIYTNTLLRHHVQDETLEIVTQNHPLPSTEKGCDSEELFIKALIIIVIFYCTFAFLSMDLVLYLFELSNKEIVDGLMYLQIMSGVPVWMYWFTTFVFDMFFYIIVIVFRVTLFAIFAKNYNFFKLTHHFGQFILILLLFGLSGLICVYIFSCLYKPAKKTYFAHVFVINFACNVGVAMCFSQSVDLWKDSDQEDGMYAIFPYVFLMVPFLNFPWTLLQYFSQWYHNNHCYMICPAPLIKWCIERNKPKEYLVFQSDDNKYGVLLETIFLLITFVFGVILFILINYGLTDYIHNLFKNIKSQQSHPVHDEDIIYEYEQIQEIKNYESRYNEVRLLVDGLSKNYVSASRFSAKSAVEDISFIAEGGTTFGILGVEGAGKTTAFYMMVDKIIPTRGNVSVMGVMPTASRKQYFSMIGYCPQTSPLLEKFTGRQMLQMIVSLKGIKDVTSVVDDWIYSLGFEERQHKNCELYSNSDKRLLSVALALIGNPSVVFLDEPTCNVDSITRRHLYDIIEYSKNSGKTVVLGSTSPNECELLCDRLTILINGVMHCIGSTHELKKIHSLGYFLMIRVHPDITSFRDVVRLEKSILNEFSPNSCRLLEEYRSLLHYQIVDETLPLSKLFRRMEEIKSQHAVIEDYMVTTTTIHDILDSFSFPSDFFSSRNISGSIQTSE